MSQKYNPSIGLQGNIELALNQTHNNYNNLAREQGTRRNDDITNREATEQNHTDDYLNLVEAQQEITELTLNYITLEARVKALEDK